MATLTENTLQNWNYFDEQKKLNENWAPKQLWNPSYLSKSKLLSFLIKMYWKHIIVEENCVLIKESC